MPNSVYIPHEIMKDILPWLPSKSLIRFKSVSTSWYSLIISPDFIHLQSIRASRNPKFLCITSRSQFHLIDPDRSSFDESCLSAPLDFPVKTPSNNFVRILGSACGIICVGIGHKIKSNICFGQVCGYAENCGSDLILWNPFIREFRKVPDFKFSVTSKNGDIAYAHGLGYDPVSNDHKLVVSKSGTTYDVFSLKSSSWKSITYPTNLSSCECLRESLATILNGVFYWLKEPYRGHTLEIIAFDSADDKFFKLEIPQVPSWPFWNARLLEHEGCLCVSCLLYEPQIDGFEIWMFKEHDWIRMVRISSEYISRFGGCTFWPKCISTSGDGVILYDWKHVLRSGEDEKFEGILTQEYGSRYNWATICFDTM